jgi:hypothetical protein
MATQRKHLRAKEHYGLHKTPEYKVWQNVVDRCRNPNNPYFHNYGGRGIKLHPEWESSFVAFLVGVGKRPDPAMTLDRMDNEKGYEPGNVRWVTKKAQAHNMRKNRMLTYNGRTQTLTAWAEEIGLVPSTLQYRLKQGGMTVAEALSVPRRAGRRPSGMGPS